MKKLIFIVALVGGLSWLFCSKVNPKGDSSASLLNKNQETLTPLKAPVPGVAGFIKGGAEIQKPRSGVAIDSKVPNLFNEFQALNRFALKSDGQRAAYRRVLADKKLITAARDVLLSHPQNLQEGDISNRMDAVEFLATSIALEGNPSEALALDSVRKVLHFNSAGLDTKDTRALLADKAELFAILATYHPEFARKLEREAIDPSSRKLFRFSRGYFGIKTKGDL